jgi:ketosteroid isomerase-like protein
MEDTMKKLIIELSYIALVLLSTAVLAYPQTDATENQLMELSNAWISAFYQGDAKAMDELEMEDLTLVMPTGEIWTKNGPRAAFQKSHDTVLKHTHEFRRVLRIGEVYVLIGQLAVTEKEKEGEKTEKSIFTEVWAKREGKWKIAIAQWTTDQTGQ